MEILGIIVALLLIGFATWRIYIISKSGTINETTWVEIRVIGYKVIDSLVKLYNTRENKDEFVDFIITEISDRILENKNLSTADKEFWNKENLTAIFRPAILALIDKIEKAQNK